MGSSCAAVLGVQAVSGLVKPTALGALGWRARGEVRERRSAAPSPAYCVTRAGVPARAALSLAARPFTDLTARESPF